MSTIGQLIEMECVSVAARGEGMQETGSDCWWVQGLSWREMRHVQCGGDVCIWVVY